MLTHGLIKGNTGRRLLRGVGRRRAWPAGKGRWEKSGGLTARGGPVFQYRRFYRNLEPALHTTKLCFPSRYPRRVVKFGVVTGN
jgi:hypothetical protein